MYNIFEAQEACFHSGISGFDARPSSTPSQYWLEAREGNVDVAFLCKGVEVLASFFGREDNYIHRGFCASAASGLDPVQVCLENLQNL